LIADLWGLTRGFRWSENRRCEGHQRFVGSFTASLSLPQ
jgi:hypothetical protein